MKVFIEDFRTGEMLKRCSKCGEYKKLGEYSKNVGKPHGVNSRCKKCEYTQKYRSAEDRFWKFYHSRTAKTGDGCLIWNGNKSMRGEPRCRWNRKLTTVRRVVYRLSVGDLPDDMFVLTTCGVKDCVRGSHLKLGTKEDRDMLRYNRASDFLAQRPPEHASGFIKTQRGVNHHSAKITDAEARAIHQALLSGGLRADIAKRFNVNISVVHNIALGRTWKQITNGLRSRKRITEKTVQEIRARFAQGDAKTAIARTLGVTYGAVRNATRAGSWKHVQ